MDALLIALLLGTLSTAVSLLSARRQLRAVRVSIEILMHRGLQAQIAELQRLGLVDPETPRPVTWQGNGAHRSVWERPTSQSYAAPAAEHNGAAVRGHRKGGALIALTCTRCGADLLHDLATALVQGCTCGRQATQRRVG